MNWSSPRREDSQKHRRKYRAPSMSATLRLELPKSLFPRASTVTVRVPRVPRFPLLGLGTLLAASVAFAHLPTPEPHRAAQNLAVGKYDTATHAAEISAKTAYAANVEGAVSVKLF